MPSLPRDSTPTSCNSLPIVSNLLLPHKFISYSCYPSFDNPRTRMRLCASLQVGFLEKLVGVPCPIWPCSFRRRLGCRGVVNSLPASCDDKSEISDWSCFRTIDHCRGEEMKKMPTQDHEGNHDSFQTSRGSSTANPRLARHLSLHYSPPSALFQISLSRLC